MHSQSMTFCRQQSVVPLLGKGGQIATPEVSIVLLQMGPAEKTFFLEANAYLKNQYMYNCTLNVEFFHHFSLTADLQSDVVQHRSRADNSLAAN